LAAEQPIKTIRINAHEHDFISLYTGHAAAINAMAQVTRADWVCTN
jgi:hypothetical protein